MEFVIGIIVGFLIGATSFKLYTDKKNKKVSGSFIMDFTDPMKDICRLELEESLDSIYSKKRISLKVITHDNSQL